MDPQKFHDGDRFRIAYNTEGTYSSIRELTGTIVGEPIWMSEAVSLAPGQAIPDAIPHYSYRPDEPWIVNPQVLPERILESL